MIKPEHVAITLALLLAACDDGVVSGDAPDTGTKKADAAMDAYTPPPAKTETCDDGYDNNGNGLVDEGCPCKQGASQKCYPAAKGTDGVGLCKKGSQPCVGKGEFTTWGNCTGAVTPATEICGNSKDEDCDGKDLPCGTVKDAGLPDAAPGCTEGQSKSCYTGPPKTLNVGICKAGKITCKAGKWGPCLGQVLPQATDPPNDGLDQNCDGAYPFNTGLFGGDCITAKCPAAAPYPIGCKVLFPPVKEPRGCVVYCCNKSEVFFKAGESCSKGFVVGHLICAKKPGPALGPTNCPIIGKTKWYYPPTKKGCPGE